MQEYEQIQELLWQGEIIEVENQCNKIEAANRTKEISILLILIQIYKKEVENGFPITIFDYSLDFSLLVKHFIYTKLFMRRADFDFPDEDLLDVYHYFKETGVSEYFILYLARQNMIHPKKTCERLAELYQRVEGAHSERAQLLLAISEFMEGQRK